LTGTAIAKWLDVELPKVQNLRLDLLGETVGDELIHLELQSGNDAAMPLRMAEYCLGVYRLRAIPAAGTVVRGRGASADGNQTPRRRPFV
jgi:hypothetical protein